MSNKSLRVVLVLSGLMAFAGAAHAQNSWDARHERRDEVNDRIAHQNERIREERREREISTQRARELHAHDHAMHHEAGSIAAHDNGHITNNE